MVNPTFNPLFVARDTEALLGPQTAGWQVSFVIYGVYLTLHTKYLLSDAYGRLARQVKVVIWIVFLLVTLYEALAFIDNFHYMVIVHRSPEQIILGWWVDFIVSLLAGSVALVVQTFLTIRASVLIRASWMQYCFLCAMGVAILTSFTGAILTTATSFMYYNNTIGSISIDFNQTVAIWLWASLAVDVAISVSLFVTLKQRIGGFNKTTDSLLRKLIVISLRTAAYTSVLAVAGAIVSLVFKDSNPAFALLHFAFWTPLPPCYAVSLYTTLGARKKIDLYLGSVYPLDPAYAGTLPRPANEKEGAIEDVMTTSVHAFAETLPIVTHDLPPGGTGGRVKGVRHPTRVYSPTIFAFSQDTKKSHISSMTRGISLPSPSGS
ncbi:DUF6534 domain-containing protein [Sporobolomyces koalae]|uniref:DUF6534 domain-containing protein n=1 Tax=Sporobolomyces koalae TaxID=500713 RepID=UPI00316B9D04